VLLQNLFHAFLQVNICTDILQQDKVSGIVHRLSQNMLVKHHSMSMYMCKCNLIYARMKSTTLFHRFSWFANACFAALHAGLLYRPKLGSKCRKYGYMLLSKVQFLLCWFSQNLKSFNAIFASIPKFSKPDKKCKNVGKISVMPSSKLLYRVFMQNCNCSAVLREDLIYWVSLKSNIGNTETLLLPYIK